MVSSTHPFLPPSPGHYDALQPSKAFEFSQDPSVGQIALAFLQASFAYSGWNFLNYVTEEVVEPRKYGTHMHRQISYHYRFSYKLQYTHTYIVKHLSRLVQNYIIGLNLWLINYFLKFYFYIMSCECSVKAAET